MLLCFLLGVGTGAGGYCYLQQDAGKARLEQARTGMITNAQRMAGAVSGKFAELSVDNIKEEMARTSVVVRDKARAVGQSIAEAAANARTTAAIKARLLAEPGLSSLAINVDTTDGVVTLSGKVSSHEQIGRVVKIALEAEGVHKVISTLQVSVSSG
jgi:osmotically-inducible protein OsmY